MKSCENFSRKQKLRVSLLSDAYYNIDGGLDGYVCNVMRLGGTNYFVDENCDSVF